MVYLLVAVSQGPVQRVLIIRSGSLWLLILGKGDWRLTSDSRSPHFSTISLVIGGGTMLRAPVIPQGKSAGFPPDATAEPGVNDKLV